MSPAPRAGDASTATSLRLLIRARRGESSALGQLLRRHLPDLRRWAHRRLRPWARSAADTADLVQDAILHTLDRLDGFDVRGRRALAAYLRRAVGNRIHDEHRRAIRRGAPNALSDALVDPGASPLDQAIASETEARYEAALTRLHPNDRELIVAHVELDYSHEQLACMTGRSRNAARVALQRAVRRLVQQMGDV
jgi:RNA polymerase sigma-70 factor, ECF subfamily